MTRPKTLLQIYEEISSKDPKSTSQQYICDEWITTRQYLLNIESQTLFPHSLIYDFDAGNHGYVEKNLHAALNTVADKLVCAAQADSVQPSPELVMKALGHLRRLSLCWGALKSILGDIEYEDTYGIAGKKRLVGKEYEDRRELMWQVFDRWLSDGKTEKSLETYNNNLSMTREDYRNDPCYKTFRDYLVASAEHSALGTRYELLLK